MPAPFRVSILACAASAAVVAIAGVGFTRTDSVIERSYANAFDAAGHPAAAAVATPAAFDTAHIHLSNLPASLGTGLAVGDRITLAQQAGGAAAFEVIEVRPLAGAAFAGPDSAGPRLVMVTAVTRDRLPSRTIRFFVDADTALDPGSAGAAKPHAL